MLIKPSIGRVVWFWPGYLDPATDQPLAALIAYVHSDRVVNLAFFDKNGVALSAVHVQLLQEDDAAPVRRRFAQWMPYQVGQAKKHAD